MNLMKLTSRGYRVQGSSREPSDRFFFKVRYPSLESETSFKVGTIKGPRRNKFYGWID
jgi:hypothetical protein